MVGCAREVYISAGVGKITERVCGGMMRPGKQGEWWGFVRGNELLIWVRYHSYMKPLKDGSLFVAKSTT